MTFPLIFTGTVEGGRLTLDDPDGFRESMKARAGGRVTVTVDALKDKRTLEQLATWWGLWLNKVAQETGNDVTALHEYCKAQFLPARTIRVVNNQSGEEQEIVTSGTTSDLNADEMTEFMERGRAWFGEFFGVTLPDPDPARRSERNKARRRARGEAA